MPPTADLYNGGQRAKQGHRMQFARAAPWYSVPPRAIVSVEHPFIVKDILKVVASLGGNDVIEKLMILGETKMEASLFLHPGDRMSKSMSSGNVRTNNILLEVTVARRTGRKRKRGSTDPYILEEDPTAATFNQQGRLGSILHPRNTRRVLRSLRDNTGKYVIRPVGIIEQTHRFRGIPDFVSSTVHNTFMQKMRDHILPFDYDKMKAFTFDMSKGQNTNADLIPPPMFTNLALPFNYSYRQNPSVKQIIDAVGNITTVNIHAPRRIHTPHVASDIATVPSTPSSSTPLVETQDVNMQRLIAQVKEFMTERPIMTRRVLRNRICIDRKSTEQWTNLGIHVFQYVGYMFDSGPWREAIIKYGVDPRSDPKYRIYQTMMFQFDTEGKFLGKKAGRGTLRDKLQSGTEIEGTNSHIFDGVSVGTDVRTWQVCDITDNMIRELLATTNLRKQCHVQSDGWFHNGTWAKAKIIARAKIHSILAGKGIRRDADFLKISTLPDVFSRDTKALYYLTRPGATVEELEWAGNVRTMASSPEKETTTGRRENVGRSEETMNNDDDAARSRERSTLKRLETLDQHGKGDADDAMLDDELDGGYSDGFLEDDRNGEAVGDDMDHSEA